MMVGCSAGGVIVRSAGNVIPVKAVERMDCCPSDCGPRGIAWLDSTAPAVRPAKMAARAAFLLRNFEDMSFHPLNMGSCSDSKRSLQTQVTGGHLRTQYLPKKVEADFACKAPLVRPILRATLCALVTDGRRKFQLRPLSSRWTASKVKENTLGTRRFQNAWGLRQNRDLTARIGMQAECGTPKWNLGGGGALETRCRQRCVRRVAWGAPSDFKMVSRLVCKASKIL